jgi:septum formation protein
VRLILASQSPRRRELLTRAGFPFDVRLPEHPVEEIPRPGERPEAYVRRLSEEKARSVHAEAGEIILGADTIVVVGDHILEKPSDHRDAARMLRLMSGRDHLVITGICLLRDGRAQVETETTIVHFAELSEIEIVEYVASGEPVDKAGAYGIQGRASKFITRIEGDYPNVVGLPVAHVYRMLKDTRTGVIMEP